MIINVDTTTAYARVAELADALDSGSSERKLMGVQVPPLAPELFPHETYVFQVFHAGFFVAGKIGK